MACIMYCAQYSSHTVERVMSGRRLDKAITQAFPITRFSQGPALTRLSQRNVGIRGGRLVGFVRKANEAISRGNPSASRG